MENISGERRERRKMDDFDFVFVWFGKVFLSEGLLIFIVLWVWVCEFF